MRINVARDWREKLASARRRLVCSWDIGARTVGARVPRRTSLPGHLHGHFTIGGAGHPSLTGRRTARLATFTANGGHVCAVSTDRHTALPSSIARFVRRPFVRRPLLVRGTPTLTCDLALSRRIHGREPASAFSGHTPPGRPD
jgi:hypothetical protein